MPVQENVNDTTLLISNKPRVKVCRFAVIVLAITLTRLLFGYDRGAMGGASIGWLDNDILTDSQYSELVSLPIFAAVGGCLFAGYLQNKLGRKMAILVSMVLYTTGLTLCVAFNAPSFYLLFIARCISNFSLGMGHVTSLVYLVEVTPAHLRGRVLVANLVVMPFGNSMSGFVNLIISKTVGSTHWRLMLGSGLILCVLQLILLLPTPRSFKWLYTRDKIQESRREADKLFNGLTNDQFRELLDISSKSNPVINEISRAKLNAGTVRRMVTVAVGLIIVGQISGFSAVLYFSIQVGHTSGIGDGTDNTTVFLASEAIFLSNFFGVLISLFVIDKLGRRRLLLISQIGTICSLALIITAISLVDNMGMKDDPWPAVVKPACLVNTCTACVAQPGCGFCSFNTTLGSAGFCIDGGPSVSVAHRCEREGGVYCPSHCHSSSNWFLGISMLLFVVYFSIGLAPIPFVIAAEIFPQHLRDLFTSISISTFYITTALVTLLFGELYPIIGMKYVFVIFGVLSIFGLLFVLLLVPETSAKTPETLHELFEEPWCCHGNGYSRLGASSSIQHEDDEEREEVPNMQSGDISEGSRKRRNVV